MKKSLLIAVDFDGTVVVDRYPAVGKPMPVAIETLKMLQADGHRIILWTYRHGKRLEEAVDFLEAGCPTLRRQLLLPRRGQPPQRREPEDSCRPLHRRPELRRISGMGSDLSDLSPHLETMKPKSQEFGGGWEEAKVPI